jgi:hypothetical protein
MKTYMLAAMAAMALASAGVVPASAAQAKSQPPAQTETNVTAGNHSGDFGITKTVFSSDHWLKAND